MRGIQKEKWSESGDANEQKVSESTFPRVPPLRLGKESILRLNSIRVN